MWILAVGMGRGSAAAAEDTAEVQGREWAQRLRTVAPEVPSTNQAVLKIRNREGRRQVPVTVITQPGKGRWSVEYQVAGASANGAVEISRIHYSTQGPPPLKCVWKHPGNHPPRRFQRPAIELSQTAIFYSMN